MTDKKISQLTNATTPVAGTEVLPIVQSGSTVKVSIDNLTKGKTVNANTFDTDVATAAVTLSGTTLAADGTDANIDISITPKGTGEVNLPKVDIDAGAIDGTAIGANSASTGAFTTLSASSTVSGTGFSTYLASPPAIGGTAAAAGTFTDLAGTGTFSAGTFSTNHPSRYRIFNVLTKTNIAPSGTAVIDIVINDINTTGFSAGVAEVDIFVGFQGSPQILQGHFKYPWLTCNNTTGGGTGTIIEMFDGSAGSFSVGTANFAVTRPASQTIRITYTSANSGGDNRIAVFVKGFSLSSVSIS